MSQRIIHLVRHGQYEVTTKEGEEPDGRLTPHGREQAHFVAGHLAALPLDIIYHSTLERATETAVLIAKKFPETPLSSSDLLRECIPSVPQGLESHFANLPQTYLQAGAQQAQEAFTRFFMPLPQNVPTQHVLLVAHGNIINSFIVRAIEAPLDQWPYLDPFHCSHSQIIVLSSGKMKLVHYNNSGYLPLSHRSL